MMSEPEPTRSAATAEFGRTELQRLPSPMFDDGRPPRFVAATRTLSRLASPHRRRGGSSLSSLQYQDTGGK
jgi:hypothetical protein